MYNYYLKYIKYRNKYLSLKGGKTPYIIDKNPIIKFLPLNYGDNIITLNNKIIKEGNKELPIYNLNSEYKYVVVPRESIVPTIIDNYYLLNHEIIKINGKNEIPFDALFLQNSYNIISKLLQLLKSKYVRPILILEKIKENIKLENNIDSFLNYGQIKELDDLDTVALLHFNQLKDSVYKFEFENEEIQELTVEENEYIELKDHINEKLLFLKKSKLSKQVLDEIIEKYFMLNEEIYSKNNSILKINEIIESLRIDLKQIVDKKSDKFKEIKNKIDKETLSKSKMNESIENIKNINALTFNVVNTMKDLEKFKMLLSKQNQLIEIKILKEETNKYIKSIEKIFRTYFNINTDTNDFINVSAKANLLNKYIFINKFRELLEILYLPIDLTDENEVYIILESEIFKLFDNNKEAFVNISDMINLYDSYTSISSSENVEMKSVEYVAKENTIPHDTEEIINKKYSKYMKKEIKLIIELRKFINYCDTIDNINGLKIFLNIKTSLLFFASFIGVRFNKLTIGHLQNNLFPVNSDNLVCNLLQIDTPKLQELYDRRISEEQVKNDKLKIYKNRYAEEKDALKRQFKTNIKKYNKKEKKDLKLKIVEIYIDSVEKELTDYDIFNFSFLPKVYNYGQSKFQNILFPDCVENTLLHFIRGVIWNPETKQYHKTYLPETTKIELLDLIDRLKLNEENNYFIKQEFCLLVQNISEFNHIYKNKIIKDDYYEYYEIISNIDNFKSIINYLFGIETNDYITDYDTYKLNPYITNIKIDNKIINIEYKNIMSILAFYINDGHSSVSIVNAANNKLPTYKFENIILLLSSNYITHAITKFNIYNKYLKNYRDIVPFYLKYLLLDKNLYFILDFPNDLDLEHIIINNLDPFIIILDQFENYDLKKILFESKIVDRFIEKINTKLFNGELTREYFHKIVKYLKIFNLESDEIFQLKVNKKISNFFIDTEVYPNIIKHYNFEEANEIFVSVTLIEFYILDLVDYQTSIKSKINLLVFIIKELLSEYSEEYKMRIINGRDIECFSFDTDNIKRIIGDVKINILKIFDKDIISDFL
jgi:hypothetical protein